MLEGFRLRAGIAYSRFRFRKERDGATRFSSALTRSRRALVILPERPVEPTALTQTLSYLAHRFPSSSSTFIVRDDLKPSLPTFLVDKVQTFSSDDVTSFFTPSSALLGKIKSSTFDVAFDLNRELVLPSAFLCKASKAPLRVSFSKDHADTFYNLQVQTHGAGAVSAYSNLLKCLEMF